MICLQAIPPMPVSPPRSDAIVAYINSITLSGRTLSYPNAGSLAEQKALNWLIEEDVGTAATNQVKLRQRFALATLWFQNGPWVSAFSFIVASDTGGWLTSVEECVWDSIRNCVGGELAWISLPSHGLSGQLPSEFGLLTALTQLQLQDNRLSGTIPSALGLLTALTGLSLNNNELTGRIPTEFEQLSALEEFYVSNNNLTGDMPFCDGRTIRSPLEDLNADCHEVCYDCCPQCGLFDVGINCRG